MSTLRRRFRGPTQAKRCEILVPLPGSPRPARCGDRMYRAGICRDHWLDKRHGQESRRGTEAVNIQRRERRGVPLPKDMTRSSVARLWEKPDAPLYPEQIDERRHRQGVSGDTQDFLVDRAALKRARKSGDVLSDPPTWKELEPFRKVRT